MKAVFLFSLVAAIAPISAHAQTAYAERSQIVGTGQDVHLYGLSTKDADGKVRCYDVAISLPIGSNGKPADAAPVVSTVCPKVKTNEFVPGTYSSPSGYTCTMRASPFTGRTEFDLSCRDSGSVRFAYSWWTGPIAGNPIEAELRAAGLDTLPGNEEYSWGQVTFNNFNGCNFNFKALLGARQVADRLAVSIYTDDTNLDCTVEAFRTGP